MTKNEAINKIKYRIKTASEAVGTGPDGKAYEDLEIAIQALEEIQQCREIGLTPELIEAMRGHNIAMINDLEEYQEIGTVEEFKALKEKSVAKKPLFIKRSFIQFYACPHCSTNEHYEKVFSKMRHCENCGGAFDWQ